MAPRRPRAARAPDQRPAVAAHLRRPRLRRLVQWDVDLWFEEGALSPQVMRSAHAAAADALDAAGGGRNRRHCFRRSSTAARGRPNSRPSLGERVREAVELLVQAHGDVLKERCADVDPADIYRAAVRVVMRMVVVLFAESRELLPRDNAFYYGAYGLTGLLEELEKVGGARWRASRPLMERLAAGARALPPGPQGSHHRTLPVPAYGGELFAPGDSGAAEGLTRALAVFETACFDAASSFPTATCISMLERMTARGSSVRQGRASTWVPAPVDFSDLSSEYIGILYEGLLDFELKTAPAGDPVVFLAVGNQPALPLSRLEAMDDGRSPTSREDEGHERAGDEEGARREAERERRGRGDEDARRG